MFSMIAFYFRVLVAKLHNPQCSWQRCVAEVDFEMQNEADLERLEREAQQAEVAAEERARFEREELPYIGLEEPVINPSEY